MRTWNPFIPLIALFLILAFLAACAQNTPDAVLNRGYRAYEEGDFLGASIYFEEFLKKFPEDERAQDVYILLAQSFNRIQDYASARTVLQEMKERFDNPTIQLSSDFMIADTYFREGFNDQAVQAFQDIISATDNPYIQMRAYTGLGNVYASMTQMASAEQMYESIYQIAENQIEDPTETLAIKLQSLGSRAEIYHASEFFDQARDVHKQALNLIENATGIVGLDVEKEKAVLNWAHTWAFAGDYISAATIYDQLHTNPYVSEELKPQLITWKVNALEQLFRETGEEEDYSPE